MYGKQHLSARIAVVVLACFMAWLPFAASSQPATPATSALANLNLPLLEITISPDGVDVPSETVSGIQQLVVHNQTEGFTVSAISQLPEGVTDEDYLGALNADELPAWTADAVTVGGLDLDPMSSGSIVIDVAAGDWLVGVSGDALETGLVEPLAATSGSSPVTASDIPVDVTWELGAYTFAHTPDTITAGSQVWQITNTHPVLHHLVMFPADGPYSNEELIDGLMALFMGTPTVDGFAPTGAPLVATAAISQGESIWIDLDLEPGYYAAFCFLPDPGSDVPHLMAGMVTSFEVLPAS